MPRIKIVTPTKTVGKAEIRVRITDINYGKHLGNDSLISIIHESRVQWLAGLGYTELNIEGTSIIMNELAVNYLNESFYGDLLNIELSVGEIGTSNFELFYNVTTTRNNVYINIAKAKTGIVFFDYELKKVIAIPSAFRNIIEDN